MFLRSRLSLDAKVFAKSEFDCQNPELSLLGLFGIVGIVVMFAGGLSPVGAVTLLVCGCGLAAARATLIQSRLLRILRRNLKQSSLPELSTNVTDCMGICGVGLPPVEL